MAAADNQSHSQLFSLSLKVVGKVIDHGISMEVCLFSLIVGFFWNRMNGLESPYNGLKCGFEKHLTSDYGQLLQKGGVMSLGVKQCFVLSGTHHVWHWKPATCNAFPHTCTDILMCMEYIY